MHCTQKLGWGRIIFVQFAVLAATVPSASASHGPGTTGGGSSTLSGETLRQGRFNLSLRTDYTDFEHISRAEAERRAAESGDHGHFDTLNHSYVSTVALEYGLLDDLTLGTQTGYYWADDFVTAHVHGDGGTGTGTHIGDPTGLMDLWLSAKYRLIKGRPGHLSVIGGIKLPTGDDDERLSGGALLEPSSQPGTGAVDYQVGLAYSRYLTPRVTFDTSGLYTFRTEHDDFKVGDRLDVGLAVNYRLTESVRQFPQYSIFAEALGVWLDKDEEEGEREENSGGTIVYFSPGLRVRLNENASLTVAPAFPVLQELNGEQGESRFRLSLGLNVNF